MIQKEWPATWRISRLSPPVTDETHRVTAFEVFVDLVFVFAFTRIISFMVHDLIWTRSKAHVVA